ncbi:hypothetical protein BGX26_005987, partial [Mortierella sp. AD094]
QLATYHFAADELDLTMDFDFGSADLKAIVRNLAKSNVKILKLDLNDESYRGGYATRLSKGKYHSLFELLSNRKLQRLTLSGMSYFASRTSDLPKNQKQSTLRSLQFYLGDVEDIPRCLSILPFSANLVELRLVADGSPRRQSGLGSAISTLKRLEVLHIIGMPLFDEESQECVLSEIVAADAKLRELVVQGGRSFQDEARDVTLLGMSNLGSRTSDLSKDQKLSTLRSFHFHLNDNSDIPRLLSILSFCTNLIDLRLVANGYRHIYKPELGRAISTLKRLEALHIIGMPLFHEESQECSLSVIVAADIKLREFMVKGAASLRDGAMDEVVHACESTLEVLIHDKKVDLQSPRFKYEYGFPNLADLETGLVTTESTLQLFDSTLKHRLSHLGIIHDRRILLGMADFTALRSLAIGDVEACDLLPLWKSFPENGGSSQIESLSLENIENCDQPHPRLMAISLRKLWLRGVDPLFFTDLIKSLVFSKLEVLAVPELKPRLKVDECDDDEDLISARQGEFSTHLMIHIIGRECVGGFKQEYIKKLDPRHVKKHGSFSDYARYDLMVL